MVGQAHNQTDHGGGTPVLDRDLLKRTSWVNASLACAQIKKVRRLRVFITEKNCSSCGYVHLYLIKYSLVL